MKKILFPLLLTCLAISCTSNKKPVITESPGKLTSIAFTVDPEQESQLYFSVNYSGVEVVSPSPFLLSIAGEPALGKNLTIESAERSIINENWERVWGKSKQVLNHCNEVSIRLKESIEPFRSFTIVARAYDDGVAFRYQLPSKEGSDSIFLGSENTTFNFSADYEVWTSIQPSFRTAQEKVFIKTNLSGLKAKDILVTPLLLKFSNGWGALLEANLTDWAGMFLTSGEDSTLRVQTLLSPLPERQDIAVATVPGAFSPWRVLMLGNKPGDLIESNLLHNLNEPNKLDDVSWIKPGRSAWDPWWSGRYGPDAGFKIGWDNESMKYFIDFASEMGWEYQLVDYHWYTDFDTRFVYSPDSDITKSISTLDIPYLVEYAKSKNVKLWLWLNWQHTDAQMDKAFPVYEKWGIAGIKVDFMNRNDQEMVDFYHRVVKKAAEHKLLVNFHGAYMPTGIDRTYPNFLTREGVLGNEANKWAATISPEHCVILPFTRMLGGHMDFTPGGFYHAPYGTFTPPGTENPNPWVQGTRCFQLAMPVVYESALTVYCDSPGVYRGQEGLEFYKIVPTTWDDTKVIDGFPGEFIIIARKSGSDWFLGAMTNDDERNLDIPLSFLGAGSYKATIYSDAPDADQFPAKLVKTERNVTAGETISVKLAHGGGCAVHFDKLD
jgi:alpha-glucosidase